MANSMTARSNATRIPSYTEVHTTSPTAAGLPVLEVVRRLEEEKLISKDDRVALKDGLYSVDVVRREEIVKALCEVELSMNSRFSLRRLKAVIHQNGGGEVSSKSQHPQHPTSSSNNGYTHIPTSTSYGSNPIPNHPQAIKPEPRPSKYRIKSKSASEAEVHVTPILDRTNSAQSTVTTTSKSSPTLTSHPVPSSSGGVSYQTNTTLTNSNQNNFLSKNNLTTAGLRLFSSPNAQTPQILQSAREKTSGPVFTGFNSSSGTNTEGQVINYTNNNIPMSSPITSRSRGEDGTSRNNNFSNPNSSSGINSNNSTTTNANNGSYNANNGLPSGRTYRTSPYRVSQSAESNNSYTTNTSAANVNTTAASSYTVNTTTNQPNNKDYNNADSDDYVENISTMDAINRVVGNQPVYSGTYSFCILFCAANGST